MPSRSAASVAVEGLAVVPAVERLMAHRRERLGLDVLRPWDTQVELAGERPLRPFSDAAGLVEPARRVFRALDPELGDQFDRMAAEGLLDLESRPGKAPGGYCTKLPWRGMPFIFMNAVGVPDDVSTLVHEAGHSFHDFAAHRQPLVWQRSVTHEAAELASMSMELLVAPHLAQPTGYYPPDEARTAWCEHLEDILVTLAHIASVDAFQAWIYTSGRGHDAEARDAAWLDVRSRFERGVDWGGLERERVARWYRQLHIFEYPFYYIEYGIAQLGAIAGVVREHLGHAHRPLGGAKAVLVLGDVLRHLDGVLAHRPEAVGHVPAAVIAHVAPDRKGRRRPASTAGPPAGCPPTAAACWFRARRRRRARPRRRRWS